MVFYIIESKLNGFALDIEGGKSRAGTHVFMYEKHGKENQVWYDDPGSGTIRPKCNHNLCLTWDGKHLKIDKYEPGNKGQQWMRQGQTIRNRIDSDEVLDIYRKNTEKGAAVGPYKYKGGENQHWVFVPVEGKLDGVTSAYYMGQKREFFIESAMNGKVLDICEEKNGPGVQIIMYEKHPDNKPNQLWYLDNLGLLRSSLSDLVPWNKEKGGHLITSMPGVDPRGQWMIQGDKLVSRAGEYMDIMRKENKNGAKVISWDLNDQENQHWKIVYL